MKMAWRLWQNLGMPIYPRKINDLSGAPSFAGDLDQHSAIGKCAAFECGTFVEIRIGIVPESKTIEAISYKSNGCGYMIAAAERLASNCQRTRLTDLHGPEEIETALADEFPNLPVDRMHCFSTVVEAFRNALAEYRAKCVEEFRGEKALICTCFGIDEERIVSMISSQNISDVSEVTALCNAGRGCGSCRMLIQELIDSAQHENLQ
jgi:NifU-like protein